MAAKKEDLNKLTVKDLREMVVKLGMSEEDADNFETKRPLISTINALRAQKVVETPRQLKKDEKKYMSKKEIMRKILMKQPRVRILIPCTGKEKPGVIKWVLNEKTGRKEQVYVSGSYTPVQINGFKWLVPHGIYDEVPQAIADMVSESQHLTAEAGKDFLIDRADPEMGGQVKDRLE